MKSSKVSLRDIALAAGISKAAAAYALQNSAEVSKETRERVSAIARQLGYIPDARVSSWMTRVRETRVKDLLPIAWINSHAEEDAWQKYQFLSPYLEGASERCRQLGYKLDELWLFAPGMTRRRFSRILYERGIEGAIVSYPAKHLHLNWDYLAAVGLGGNLLAPRLHQVTIDRFFNFLLAVKMVKRAGYERIGVCLEHGVDQLTNYAISATTHRFTAGLPKSSRVTPLFYLPSGRGADTWVAAREEIIRWVRRQKPDAIVGHSNWLVECVEAAGYRVPEDIGVVHIANDDDVKDWAGIFSNKRSAGASAVDLVVSHVEHRQFGMPATPLNTTIRGWWQPGWTLLFPKPDRRPSRKAESEVEILATL